ncbi:MAG TPA: immunoglobulin domain-containing protein, partial [Prosthecobacter sp.]|nr:immunoglobulin domain-containing protein [Prosthecobacter sp.]
GISTMWASSVNTVFLAAASGMIFTNSPALVPEITVEQPAATALQSGKDTIDFGPAVVPGNAVRTFTVRSTGSADLTGLSITKSGTHANDFAVGALGATTLAPGASTTFEVTFTPSADGARTALISIASNDLDEPLFTISLTGTGQVAVSFSTHPVSKSVNPNTAVSFTCVVAAGVTKPITYQWQKYNIGITAWENVTGATAASYTIPKALEAHEGDYRCMATNPVSAVPSNAATLLVNEPVAITSQPLPLTVGTGSSFSFTVATTGSEPKKYVWRRNGAAIAGAPNLPTYTVNAAQIAHAGDYSVIVSNPVNTLTSANANLTVIDTAAKTVKASAGTKAVLTASYSGKPTGFVWKKGGDALPADFRYTYVKNVLSIAACQVTPSDDSGMYTCEITGLDGNSVTSTVNLVVYNDLPEVTGVEPLAMPDAMIGDPTYSHQIPFNPSPLKSPTSFTAAGLPTGLTCNATTGLITGNPSVALTANKTYSVTLTATNARGKSAKKANLTVKALPSATVGVYAGPVERSPALNNNLGGRFELTTTTNGSFTGKVVLGKTSYAIKGRLISDVSGTAAPSGTAIIKRTLPLANLTVSFRFDPDNHVLQDCDITDATAHVAFAAWHKRWGTVMSSADSDDLKTYLGYYTFGIVAPVPAVTPPTTASEIHPQGVGYGAFTVGASGALTAAGKLADGTAFTSATFCGPRGEVLIFQTLYTSLGSILGTLDITQGTAAHTPAYGDNTLDGGISWLRPQMLGTNRVYRSGFGPLDCEAAGGRYVPPLKPALLFGVADDGVTNNATLAFTEGGLSGTTTDPVGTQTKPDVEVRIKSSGVFVPTNPRGTTLTLAPTTGLFSGKATLIDANPAKPGTNITRVLNYYGIVSRDGGGQFRGYAFFFLARRPDELSTQTITTTDQLSGQVVFEKK